MPIGDWFPLINFLFHIDPLMIACSMGLLSAVPPLYSIGTTKIP